MQGGGRPQGQTGAGAGNQQGTVPVPGPHLPQGLDVGGGRSSLGPSGVAVGPAGPMPPHHYRLMPPFVSSTWFISSFVQRKALARNIDLREKDFCTTPLVCT